jgi:hypothetical protein
MDMLPDSADRPAITEDEIEMTPEMIEAGVEAAYKYLYDVYHIQSYELEAIAIKVFLAMTSCACSQR